LRTLLFSPCFICGRDGRHAAKSEPSLDIVDEEREEEREVFVGLPTKSGIEIE
jgi:hypothetical protein